MLTHEVPPAILDRLVVIDDQMLAVVRWLRVHPNAHPDETGAKWSLYDELESEYSRLNELRNRYQFAKE